MDNNNNEIRFNALTAPADHPTNDNTQPIEKHDLRSHEANDLLERTPPWLVRGGVTSVAVVLLILSLVAILVRYPDTLEGDAILTTEPLAIKMKASSSGRILNLFIADGSSVTVGEMVAEVENNTGYLNIILLQNLMDSARSGMIKNNMNNKPFEAAVGHHFGEAQDSYNRLTQYLNSLQLLKGQEIYRKRLDNLKQQIGIQDSLSIITTRETDFIKDELNQADERFKANESLYKEKVISRQQYLDEETKLRSKKLAIEQQVKNRLTNNLTSNLYNKQSLDIQYERSERELQLLSSIDGAIGSIDNFIQSWKLKYLVVAPYSGKLHYLKSLQVNETVGVDEMLFSIVPISKNYIAIINIPAKGIGKAAIGQTVQIALDNFPYNEYGYLQGKVVKIGYLPQTQKNMDGSTLNTYRVEVSLTIPLITTFKMPIPFTLEMSGWGKLITKDRNLLQRLMAGLKGMKG